MNPELPVEGASFLNKSVRIAKARARHVCVIPSAKKLPVGVVHN